MTGTFAMKRSGIADLPLHHGTPPRWLWHRMVSLSGAIAGFIADEFGTREFLRRMADPYWFQAFSCVIGFDWHSSGTTTTTCGALKQGVDPERIGMAVTGGKGRNSRNTLREIPEFAEAFSLPDSRSGELLHASRITAKVDNSCIQDSYTLYHHSFLFDEKGNWCVIQQGMGESPARGNRAPAERMTQSAGRARRYHWLHGVDDFVKEPHEGIACDSISPRALDMTASKSREARRISVDLVKDRKGGWEGVFERIRREQKARAGEKRQASLLEFFPGETGRGSAEGRVDAASSMDEGLPHLVMPAHHPVLDMDLSPRDFDVLHRAYEIQPANYEELISIRGMGPKKIRALALMSDLIYGADLSWKDPVKYSFSHGGKDGYPFPVDRDSYDNSISFLRDALYGAEMKQAERRAAMKRLEQLLR